MRQPLSACPNFVEHVEEPAVHFNRQHVTSPADPADDELLHPLRVLRGPDAVQPAPDTLVVRIEAGVSKDVLLHELADKLAFPGWFGYNWDALYDCLRDLNWIPERRVVLLHEPLSAGFPDEDLLAYLEVLQDAIRDWEPPGSERQLEAVFSPGDGEWLAAVLRG